MKFPKDFFKDILPEDWTFQVKSHRKAKSNEAYMSLFVEYPCRPENIENVDIDFIADMLLIELHKIHSEDWIFGSIKPNFKKGSVVFDFACIQV